MPFQKTLKNLHAIILVCISLGACKKGNQSHLAISSISPNTGPYSTIVTIEGSGFSSNAADDKVQINKVDAIVQKASATELTVIVPKAAGSGPVIVNMGGQVATGPDFNFIYTISVSTLSGMGVRAGPGYKDGNGDVAQFNYPTGVTCDAQGNVYVGDQDNNCIRVITPLGVTGTFAGNTIYGYIDGNGNEAEFEYPNGLANDKNGNIYVADQGDNRIRKLTPSGVVSTLAGNGTPGYLDGTGATAQFNAPIGMTCDADGNVYVSDNGNDRIRKITPSGQVSTFAGTGVAGFTDGAGDLAQFDAPDGLASDAQGNIYVAEFNNRRIRKITPSGEVSTFAGSGVDGSADGSATTAQFNHPYGVACDAQNNIYVTDYSNDNIRRITPAGIVSTLAGNGVLGYVDGPGTVAEFFYPIGIASDGQGNIYIGDSENECIRKITVE